MKKNSFGLLLALGLFHVAAFAQKKEKTTTKTESLTFPSIHQIVFEQAKQFGDAGTSITSLHYLVASDPVKYAAYADTLAQVYLNVGYYNQSNALVTVLLQRNPASEYLMQIKAGAVKGLGQQSEAADWYGRLFTANKNPRYGIELLQLQLALQRLPECLATSKMLLEMDEIKDKKIAVPAEKENTVQEVSWKGFIHYIEGLAYNLRKETPEAIKAMEAAVAADADFYLAKMAVANLKAPDSKEEGK